MKLYQELKTVAMWIRFVGLVHCEQVKGVKKRWTNNDDNIICVEILLVPHTYRSGFCSVNLMTFKWVRSMGICFNQIGHKSSYSLPVYTRSIIETVDFVCLKLVNNFFLFAFGKLISLPSVVFKSKHLNYIFILFIPLHNAHAHAMPDG